LTIVRTIYTVDIINVDLFILCKSKTSWWWC